jgi:hypothetical protein
MAVLCPFLGHLGSQAERVASERSPCIPDIDMLLRFATRYGGGRVSQDPQVALGALCHQALPGVDRFEGRHGHLVHSETKSLKDCIELDGCPL